MAAFRNALVNEVLSWTCPSCGVAVERTDGCLAMQCGACRARFCLICAAQFANSQAAHAHCAGECEFNPRRLEEGALFASDADARAGRLHWQRKQFVERLGRLGEGVRRAAAEDPVVVDAARELGVVLG